MLPASVPLPDPDLIKPCCHHLPLLIPLQYLYLPLPPTKAGVGQKCSCSRRGWLAGGAAARRHLLLGARSICYDFSLSPHAVGYGFSPRWAVRARCQPIIVCPACSHGAGLVAVLPALAVCNPRYCVIGQCH